MHLDVAQLRQRSHVEQRLEIRRSASGAPREIRFESRAGVDRAGWRGVFGADQRTLTVTPANGAPARTLTLPAELVLPDGVTTALAPIWRDRKPQARLAYLDVGSVAVTSLVAQRIDEPASNAVRIGLTTDLGRSRAREETVWIDDQGALDRWEQRLLGASLVWQPCAKDCDASVEHPFDPMAGMVLRSPFRVPSSALAGPIRYVVSRSSGTGAPRLPATGEQAVAIDGDRAVVTICKTCGVAESLSEADRQQYLAPNAWVQSDARPVRAFASRNAGSGTPDQVMARLVTAVMNHMTGEVDYLGYATAREALRSRAGDCTEFAVLLAAAARASGIPTRVVAGLAYSDRFSGKKDVFSPHMWVQAWTGTKWTSYDAGLGQFDATHIALAVGDGDPRGMDAVADATRAYRIDKLGLVKPEN